MFNLFAEYLANKEKNKKSFNIPAKDLPVEVMTASGLDQDFHKRISKIQKEFIDGFTFINKYPKSVTFFGSARLPETDPYYLKARTLAGMLAKDGYAIFSGGGPGIMEAANRGAFEVGGQALGLNIKLPMEQTTNPYVTDHLDFHYFFTRKVCMTFSSEAFVCFPGGFGTLDEFFEILTLIQTKKIPRAPIVLVGKDFWTPLITWIDTELRNRFQTIDPEDTNLYVLLDDENLIVNLIKENKVR